MQFRRTALSLLCSAVDRRGLSIGIFAHLIKICFLTEVHLLTNDVKIPLVVLTFLLCMCNHKLSLVYLLIYLFIDVCVSSSLDVIKVDF